MMVVYLFRFGIIWFVFDGIYIYIYCLFVLLGHLFVVFINTLLSFCRKYHDDITICFDKEHESLPVKAYSKSLSHIKCVNIVILFIYFIILFILFLLFVLLKNYFKKYEVRCEI